MFGVRGRERIKLVGKVTTKQRIVIGRSIGCGFDIAVLNSKGKYDSYEIIVRKNRPWKLKPGAKVVAVGILLGDTLWADYFRKRKY